MRKRILYVALAAMVSTPAQAADWQREVLAARPGAFVGARVKLPLGGDATARPRAALTLAPTMTRMASSGFSRTSVGEGIALNFGIRSKPTLTLAGLRADTALGLARRGKVDGDRKLGMSTTGWVAVGVGTALVVGAAVFYAAATSCPEHADECG